MDFAVVEPKEGLLDFIVNLKPGKRGSVEGKHWLFGQKVEVPLDRVVHVGVSGNSDSPPMTWQWCPAWTLMAMHRAGIKATRGATPARSRRAANPQGADGNEWVPEQDPDGVVRLWRRWYKTSSGKTKSETKTPWVAKRDPKTGSLLGYQWSGRTFGAPTSGNRKRFPPPGDAPVLNTLWHTTTGTLQQTPRSVSKRKKEQSLFRSAFGVEPDVPAILPAIDPRHYYGHLEIMGFLHSYRKSVAIEPQNVLFALMFGALSANESTKAAEKNLAGLSKLIRKKVAAGREIGIDLLTNQEFLSVWTSGFSSIKWKALQALYSSVIEITSRLAGFHGKGDRALRCAIIQELGAPGGLGLIKFSFALECLGQDVACLDRWMFRGLGLPLPLDLYGRRGAPPEGGLSSLKKQIADSIDSMKLGSIRKADRKKERARRKRASNKLASGLSYWPRGIFYSGKKCVLTLVGAKGVILDSFKRVNQLRRHNNVKPLSLLPPYAPFSEEAYAVSEWGLRLASTPRGLALYEWFEGLLSQTAHYQLAVRDGVPNPLGRAQWTFWEDIMRSHPDPRRRIDRATHQAMFEAMFGVAGYRAGRLTPAQVEELTGTRPEIRPVASIGSKNRNPTEYAYVAVGRFLKVAIDQETPGLYKLLLGSYRRVAEGYTRQERERFEKGAKGKKRFRGKHHRWVNTIREHGSWGAVLGFEPNYDAAAREARQALDHAIAGFVTKNEGKFRTILGDRTDLRDVSTRFHLQGSVFEGSVEVVLGDSTIHANLALKYVVRTIPRVTPYYQYPLVFTSATVKGKLHKRPSQAALRKLLTGKSGKQRTKLEKLAADKKARLKESMAERRALEERKRHLGEAYDDLQVREEYLSRAEWTSGISDARREVLIADYRKTADRKLAKVGLVGTSFEQVKAEKKAVLSQIKALKAEAKELRKRKNPVRRKRGRREEVAWQIKEGRGSWKGGYPSREAAEAALGRSAPRPTKTRQADTLVYKDATKQIPDFGKPTRIPRSRARRIKLPMHGDPKRVVKEREIRIATQGKGKRAPLIVNFGGGRDSTAVLIRFAEIGIRPDYILFGDTGGEKPETYAHIKKFSAWLKKNVPSFPPVTWVRNVPPGAGWTSLEGACLTNRTLPSLAFGQHSCSLRSKVEPMNRFLRREKKIRDAWGRMEKPYKVIGYDASPADQRRFAAKGKAENAEGYRFWYPLVEWGWDRRKLSAYIKKNLGYLPPKSACFFCPATKKPELVELAEKTPDLFTRSIVIEDMAAPFNRKAKGLGRNWSWRGWAQENGYDHLLPENVDPRDLDRLAHSRKGWKAAEAMRVRFLKEGAAVVHETRDVPRRYNNPQGSRGGMVRRKRGRRAEVAWQIKLEGGSWKGGYPSAEAAWQVIVGGEAPARRIKAKRARRPPRALPMAPKKPAAPRSSRKTAKGGIKFPSPKKGYPVPDLTKYAKIVVNTSGGKDSQAMLTYVAWLAAKQGVKDRLHVVHADLGRVEWQGTKALAARQAALYGLDMEVCRREKGDLLSQVKQRKKWPGTQGRYCTSDQKTSQVAKIFTRLGREAAKAGWPKPVPMLSCLGIRGAESGTRRKRGEAGAWFAPAKAQWSGNKHVTVWWPIFNWSHSDVWRVIKESGVPYHSAYDKGMSRLSCVFCVFASKKDLQIAGKHNRKLFEEYAKIEREIGHTFTAKFSLDKDLRALLKKPAVRKNPHWQMNPSATAMALVRGYMLDQLNGARLKQGYSKTDAEAAEWGAVAARWQQLLTMVRTPAQAAKVARVLPKRYLL